MSLKGSKICFVSLDNLNRVPYVELYASWVERDYDVVYWNRSDLNESIGESECFCYRRPIAASADGENKIQKLKGYLGFRKFAKSILKANDYDLVFALTGNCAVLISDILLKKYSGRYVVDIRDYWHEDFTPYHSREEALIKQSALTVISSPAYRVFLCEHDYAVMHNDQVIAKDLAVSYWQKSQASDPFVICCVGAMKNPEYDRMVIEYFANDPRFELRFIGRGYDSLSGFVDANRIENVVIKGAFPMDETLKQYEGADAVLNMYGNHSPYWDYALSNKLYFAARLHLPILVCKDTAMASFSEKYGFGYAIDLGDKKKRDKDRILQSFTQSEIEKRRVGCEEFLSIVDADNRQVQQRIKALCVNGDKQ